MESHDIGSIIVTENDKPVGILTDRKIALACKDHESLGSIHAEELMTDSVETVSADTGIFDVIRTLKESGVRRMPVVAEDGTLDGIVTFDDLVVLLADEFTDLSEIVRQQSQRF